MRVSYPSTAQYREALILINNAASREQSDAMFYEWLLQNIPASLDEGDKLEITSVIREIANDEMLHREIFKSMYRQLTGQDTTVQDSEFVEPEDFKDGIVRALKDEMTKVKIYRKIRAGLPDNSYRDQVFSILTDEIRHGILYNYIYTSIVSQSI